MYPSINENNLFALEKKRRYENSSIETQKNWDEWALKPFKQLELIKRKRNLDINVGDVFVLSPRPNIYFYGKILKTKIVNNSNFIKDKQTAIIFRCKSKTIDIENFKPTYDKFLMNPFIVDRSYWTQGFFFSIGNIPLTEEERNLDYGFFLLNPINGEKSCFCTEENKIMEHRPKFFDLYSIITITGVSNDIEQTFIFEPELLEFD